MSIINLKNISRSFGKKEVLNDLSLTISDGEVFGLIGLNGAGKTTLIRIILGLIGRDRGEVSLLGTDPYGTDVEVLAKVGVVLEHNGFYGNLSVAENLRFYAKAKNLTNHEFKEFYNEYVAQSDIGKKNNPVKFFSRGEKMQCALFRAFMGWPDILIFDEPTVGLDMDAYSLFLSMCKTAAEKGSTLFISSHHLEAIDQLCDRIGLLENGNIKILDDEKTHHTWTIRILDHSIESKEKILSSIKAISDSDVDVSGDLYSFRLAHDTSDDIIPKLVKELIALNCSITEVRPEIKDVKTSLKNFSVSN